MTYDVVVVGAGPAGSATAILLAERGWSVLLLDKASFPRPKICGELLSPESARLLDRLGALKAVDAEAQPIAGMRIVAPDGTRLEGRYPAGAPWGGYRGHGLAIPRERLDHILFERARQLPLDARERHRVTGLRMEAGAVAGVQVEAPASAAREVASRLVVAADGRASVVAHALGLLRPHRLRRMALIQHVRGLEGLVISARSTWTRRTTRFSTRWLPGSPISAWSCRTRTPAPSAAAWTSSSRRGWPSSVIWRRA